jgi:DNA-binding transcriptional MerR regulator
MPLISMEKALPSIPAKRYFTIGEVSELCEVKPYVLRYWEQEFTQLRPMKRRGNRRYYQHHEVLLIRRIRDLLYDQGFTISGARNRLSDALTPTPVPADGHEGSANGAASHLELATHAIGPGQDFADGHADTQANGHADAHALGADRPALGTSLLRAELMSIRKLLSA